MATEAEFDPTCASADRENSLSNTDLGNAMKLSPELGRINAGRLVKLLDTNVELPDTLQ